MVAGVGRVLDHETQMSDIRFDLSNTDALQFLRAYDFAWARRQIIFDVEAVRAIFLRAETEGRSLSTLSREIEGATQLDAELADLLARTETIRAANAGAIAYYKHAGIDRLAWIAGSDACQYCRKLNGCVTPIGTPFLDPGEFQARKEWAAASPSGDGLRASASLGLPMRCERRNRLV
jgi:hypothetical protein